MSRVSSTSCLAAPGARRWIAAAIVLLSSSAGCTWGTTQERYAQSMNGAGSPAVVTLTWGARMRGELLVVDSTGVIIRGDRITRVEWLRVRQLEVTRPARLRLTREQAMARQREVALYGRFPHGVSPEVLARLVAAVNRDTLDVLR